MISIETNEKYNSKSVRINNKVLADLNKQTGQWEYHKHQIQVLSEIKSKEFEGKFGKFTSCWFKGTLDNNSEQLTFFMSGSELRQLQEQNVDQGDTIEVSGGFYMSKKNEFKTCVNIRNLSTKEKQLKLEMPQIVIDWNNHFKGNEKSKDNTFENFKDTVREEARYNDKSDEDLRKWFNELILK